MVCCQRLSFIIKIRNTQTQVQHQQCYSSCHDVLFPCVFWQIRMTRTLSGHKLLTSRRTENALDRHLAHNRLLSQIWRAVIRALHKSELLFFLQSTRNDIGFEALTAATVKSTIFWESEPCSLAVKMESICSFETSVNFYLTEWRYIPEDHVPIMIIETRHKQL